MNSPALFVQFFCQNKTFVSETKIAAITIDGGKHKGSAFVVGRVFVYTFIVNQDKINNKTLRKIFAEGFYA